MAGTGSAITIDIRQARKAIRAMQDGTRGAGLTKLIGQRLLEWIGENFSKAGAERAWPPLAPNTIAARRKGKGGGTDKPLRDTGTLSQSFLPGARGNVLRSDDAQATVGSNIRYASYHETGTDPYTIRPIRGRFLVFETTEGRVRARVVHHPGIPQRKILPSVRLGERLAMQVIEGVIRRKMQAAGER